MTNNVEILLADDGSPSGYSLPAIDLARFTNGSEEDRELLGRRFDEGLQKIGFAVVQNHGLPLELFDRTLSVTREFFDLTPAEKVDVASRGSQGQFCGWVSYAADAAARVYGASEDSPPDLRERYRAVITPHEEVRERTGPNLWPSKVPNMQAAWEHYYQRLEGVSMRVMSVCAQALGLPLDFFEAYFARHFSVLMSTFSPPLAKRPEGHDRCSPHTDTGTFTFVYQPDAIGGVQVQLPDGRWGAPQTRRGDIVVNCADLMAVWTNDRWKSTIHRVGGPNDRLDRGRQSMVFFHQPSLDVEIECLPSCKTDRPAKYQPLTLRDHFDMNQKQLSTREEPLDVSA